MYYLQSRYYDPELGRFINADNYPTTGQGFVGNNMFAYCLNNPIVYGDYTGCDAILLLDTDNVGHMGIMAQDGEGTWWHFYWGTSGLYRRVLCAFKIPVKPTTWCVEYPGDLSLSSINESSQYSGNYDDRMYLAGDFSSCIDEMKKPSGNYNLYTANCSQISLGILAKAETPYSDALSNAAERMLPASAFSSVKAKKHSIRKAESYFEHAFRNALKVVAHTI